MAAALLAVMPASAQAPAEGASRSFATGLRPGQVTASRLIGTTVVSTNNESIGDVNDILLDREGRIAGVVVGVGGFLGIGEKDVAVPFEALEFTDRPVPGTRPAARNAPSTGAEPPGNGMPERVTLRMTKADLEAAPAFLSSRRGDGAPANP